MHPVERSLYVFMEYSRDDAGSRNTGWLGRCTWDQAGAFPGPKSALPCAPFPNVGRDPEPGCNRARPANLSRRSR